MIQATVDETERGWNLLTKNGGVQLGYRWPSLGILLGVFSPRAQPRAIGVSISTVYQVFADDTKHTALLLTVELYWIGAQFRLRGIFGRRDEKMHAEIQAAEDASNAEYRARVVAHITGRALTQSAPSAEVTSSELIGARGIEFRKQ